MPITRRQNLGHAAKETRGVRAIDGAVVERERQHSDRVDGNGFKSVIGRDDHRRSGHGVGRENGDLGLVDDRPRQQRPVRTGIGDGEGAVGQFIDAELLRPRARRHVSNTPREIADAGVLRVLKHRDDEAVVLEVDGDPQVDASVHDEFIVAHRGVQV